MEVLSISTECTFYLYVFDNCFVVLATCFLYLFITVLLYLVVFLCNFTYIDVILLLSNYN